MASLAVKHRPKSWEDVTEQGVAVDILKSICESDDLQNRNFLLVGPAGTGKAQPLYSKVLTPEGFIEMKDVKPGTLVYTHNGYVARVDFVFPQGFKAVYRFVLSDGTSLEVAEDHLNHFEKDGEIVSLTTKQFLEMDEQDRKLYKIPNTCVEFSDTSKLKISPYIFGVFMALGHIRDSTVSLMNPPESVENEVSAYLDSVWGYQISKGSKSLSGKRVVHPKGKIKVSHMYCFQDNAFENLRNLRNYLYQCGYEDITDEDVKLITNTDSYVSSTFYEHHPELKGAITVERLNSGEAEEDFRQCMIDEGFPVGSELRHIPKKYLMSSKYNRLQLLSGILAGCGFCNTVEHPRLDYKSSVFVSSFSASFSSDFAFLVRSLGIVDKINFCPGYYADGNRKYTMKYFHQLRIPLEYTELPNTRTLYSSAELCRTIAKVEKLGNQECQCIYVDDAAHTYLTDNFIPTHNTTIGRIMANVLNDGQGTPIEIDAASHNGVDSVREIVQQAQMYPVGSKYKVFILDECFSADTLVHTESGHMPISHIRRGMKVYGLGGLAFVDSVFQNRIPVERIVRVNLVRGSSIVTTRDHLFFTNRGWKRACELSAGTELYNSSYVESARRMMYDKSVYQIDFDSSFIHLEESEDTVSAISSPTLVEDLNGVVCDVLYSDYESNLCKVINTHHLEEMYVVESVEAYETLKTDEYFWMNLPEVSEDRKFVTMFDLQIGGHPSYFVNDIAVHNCHAFSTQAWQILLKVLEEGPAKTVFTLCTTNPEKIPPTIISRVQMFQLSKISLEGIVSRLKEVVQRENDEGAEITYSEEAIQYLAKLANGGMRDALTLLEKSLAYSKDITSESLSLSLGLPNYDSYFDLLQAYAKQDNKAIAQIVNDVYNSGVNFIKWFEQFHSFVINVVKYILLQDISSTIIPTHYQERIAKYGPSQLAICLKLANRLVQLNAELKTTQYLQEFALTYLCSIPRKKAEK